MSTAKKLLIGLSTFAPLLALIFIIVQIVSTALQAQFQPDVPPTALFFSFIGVYLVLLATAIANVIIYINLMVKNRKLSEGDKVLWLCLLFFFHFFVMLVYYFMYVVTDKRSDDFPA